MAYPAFVSRFRDSLASQAINTVELDLTRPPVSGHRGILTTSVIQYNHEAFNLLGRDYEFTFYPRNNERVEISLQLYLTNYGHWRLFAYCRGGMLLSINLSTLSERGRVLTLSNKIHLSTRGLTTVERYSRAARLCACLTELGLEVDEEGRLILGTFDVPKGKFVDTTPKAFLRDFTLAALLKGHFMGNKGYELPRLPRVKERLVIVREGTASSRSIPLGLRFEALQGANFRCVACGNGPANGRRLHVDHIVPFSQGGRTERRNLQVLCQLCNLGKGNRSSRRIRAASG